MAEMCINCKKEPVFVKSRKLGKKCYHNLLHHGELLKNQRGLKGSSSDREIEFIKNYFQHDDWIYHPARFNLNSISYTPDFYDGQRNVFIEVAGTRQAYHLNKDKYVAFKKLFPRITLEIRDATGKLIEGEAGRIHWMTQRGCQHGDQSA